MEKKQKLNKEFIQEFKKAIAYIYQSICQKWIQDEDSGNNYNQTQVKQVETYDFMKVVFQPASGDNLSILGNVLLIVNKDVKIRKLEKDAMKKIREEVDTMLRKDYLELRELADGYWYRNISVNASPKEILNISSPWKEINSHTWKLSFYCNDDIHGRGSFGWMPKSISEFLDDFDEEWYQEIIDKFKYYKNNLVH